MTNSHDEVLILRNSTPCPYAADAIIRTVPPVRLLEGSTAGIKEAADITATFIAGRDVWDMVALPIAGADSLPALATGLRRVLIEVVERLGRDWGQVWNEALKPTWRLSLGGRELFGLVFSPLYSGRHPRFTPTASSILLLHDEMSFTRRTISSTYTHRQAVSLLVERRFRLDGRAYHPDHRSGVPKSLRMLKNETGRAGLTWWQEHPAWMPAAAPHG